MDNKIQNYSLLIYSLRGLSIAIALIMLDTPIVLISIITLLIMSPTLCPNPIWFMICEIIYSLARPSFYILALIVTVGGKQDALAIIFYILFVVQVFGMIKKLILTFANLFTAIK